MVPRVSMPPFYTLSSFPYLFSLPPVIPTFISPPHTSGPLLMFNHIWIQQLFCNLFITIYNKNDADGKSVRKGMIAYVEVTPRQDGNLQQHPNLIGRYRRFSDSKTVFSVSFSMASYKRETANEINRLKNIWISYT